MAFSNLALYGGAFFTPVIVGITTERIGWKWTFWLVVIFGGVFFPLIFFFVPETAYRRPEYLNLDISSNDNPNMIGSGVQGSSKEEFDDVDVPEHIIPEKDSFLKTLLPFNGRKTDDTFWKIFLRPLPLIFHPAVFWGMLTQGTLIGWTVMIGVDIAWFYMCELSKLVI